MESLSPECTPLKHRYDSCFNSWFEGYLQPALDADAARASRDLQAQPRDELPPILPLHQQSDAVPGPSRPPAHRPIITNWAGAFPNRIPRPIHRADTVPEDAQALPVYSHTDTHPGESYVIDTKGKTRNQIKAEEYDRRCGSAWRTYQHCLQKAIEQNQGLATLLNQARDEHPLKDQNGLKGSVWDADYAPDRT